jgi:ribosomal protein L34E
MTDNYTCPDCKREIEPHKVYASPNRTYGVCKECAVKSIDGRPIGSSLRPAVGVNSAPPLNLPYIVDDGYPHCGRCGELVRGVEKQIEHMQRHMEAR